MIIKKKLKSTNTKENKARQIITLSKRRIFFEELSIRSIGQDIFSDSTDSTTFNINIDLEPIRANGFVDTKKSSKNDQKCSEFLFLQFLLQFVRTRFIEENFPRFFMNE